MQISNVKMKTQKRSYIC